MFTGLIEAIGSVQHCSLQSGDFRLTIAAPVAFMGDVGLGDSIAVNGICLTVTNFNAGGFSADVSVETMASTTVKHWRSGHRVNLEKALTLAARLGGHIVTGHVDGVGSIVHTEAVARSWRIEVEAPAALHGYLAPKGSVTVDGVSLTINGFRGGIIELNIVPHTAQETTLERLEVGAEVHLEVDILARYTEQLLRYGQSGDAANSAAKTTLSKQFLAEHGFFRN